MRRYVKIAAVVVLAAAGLFLALRAWTRWSDANALATARRELSNGRPAGARERLVRLAAKNPGHAETEYLLGLAEQAAGNTEEAYAAWSRVPPGSAEFPDSAVRLGSRHAEFGRFADAERTLTKALEDPRGRETDLRQLLLNLYWREGRVDEVRRLVQANFMAISEAQGPTAPLSLLTLRTHLSMDLDPYPVDQFDAELAALAARSPDDDRLMLARGNLATRAGRFADAAKFIDECVKRRPTDPPAWRAALDLGMASGSLERVEEAVSHLNSNDVPAPFGFEVAAWVGRARGAPLFERSSWLNLLALDKAHPVALERLAELEIATGQPGKAVEMRKLKAEVDAAKRAYRGLLQSDYASTAGEMLPLAERLGRMFEAFALMSITRGIKPSQARNHPMYGRFHTVGVDPILGPGQPLRDSIGLNLAPPPTDVAPPTSDDRGGVPLFEERAAAAGLNFTFRNGRSALRQLPETMSGGVGLLDYDGDGRLDVYAVQGGIFPPDPARPGDGDRLFRNKGDGTFEDATERAGLAKAPKGYSMGVAVGDYDSDGRPDLFVTRWRAYVLLRNKGDGTYEDATAAAGLGGPRDWPTSAAWGDLDGDGDLDLYVCHYLDWDDKNPKPCRDGAGGYSYCDPRLLPALPDHVFRNDGGKFTDVTKEAGFVDKDGRGLGVLIADLDDDGLVDVFVANDGTANLLFHNRGNFKFEEVALASGVAGNAEGGFQAGMGIACGDLDGDERPDLVVTNFYGESATYYQNLGEGNFGDRTASVGLAAATRTLLGFGAVLADFNNDGDLDLATTNGHVNDLRPAFPYAMPSQLLLGGRSGRLRDATAEAGPAWSVPRVGRGLACGDLDDDGRPDVLILPQEEPLVYLRNLGPKGESPNWAAFALEGTKSNRDGVGAKVRLKAGGRARVARRFGGGSYQSAGDPRLRFGLGKAPEIDEVTVEWPSGTVDVHKRLKAGAVHRLKEGSAPAPGRPTLTR